MASTTQETPVAIFVPPELASKTGDSWLCRSRWRRGRGCGLWCAVEEGRRARPLGLFAPSLYSIGPSSGSVVARGASPVVDASRGRNDPRKATLGRRAWRGLDVSPAPRGRGCEARPRAAAIFPAGECGGKDQVSRARTHPDGAARWVSRRGKSPNRSH